MIVFDLKCARGHVFEAWFQDGAAYERQARAGKVTCPVCADTRVAKAPMAPNVAAGRQKGTSRAADAGSAQWEKAAALMRELRAVREAVEKSCEYVGPRFAEEARKIHYGEAKKQGIYGEATRQEARALKDEGIDFGCIPWLPRHDA